MSRNKRLSILTAAEIEDLYGVPSFNESYQRFYFTLNDKERAELARIRQRKYRCIAVALLGYFKCKPILLNATFKSMQEEQGSENYMETEKCVSPVASENINFRGTYTFAPTGELPKLDELMAPIEGYRPQSES